MKKIVSIIVPVYNVEKFMDMIIDNMPRERRKLVA